MPGVVIPGQGTHQVLYVATENDSVYAFDAETGAVLWRASMLGMGETPSDTLGCSQVTPEIGITSTPVIDPTRRPNGAIYVVAMSKQTVSGGYVQRLHALDLTTGTELFGGPTLIQGSVPGRGAGSSGGHVIFAPKQYEERAGLLLLNGQIITAWTSHCDSDPYTGWIMAYNATTLAQVSILNVTPNGSRGAFWMAGAGPAADSAGNVYLLDGNGTFDTTLDAHGFPGQGDFGNGFLKLSTSNGLAVADYFEMFNTVDESNNDVDLGSGGTLVLPDLFDAARQVHHLAVGAGKDAHIYVVDRDSMGKWNATTNMNYQDITGALGGSVFSMPAYFNNTLYYGASGDAIKAFPLVDAVLSSSPASATAQTFTYPGATPGISANGNANAILWAVENSSPAVLHAYDAGDLSRELYNSNQASNGRDAFGPGNKFITPTIINGHVYVGTASGVAAFGIIVPHMPLQVPGDFEGDGKADLSVYRPSTGQWYILESSKGYSTSVAVTWGVSSDIPVPGDYDGDGKTDPAVFRPSTGTWYILKSSTNYKTSIVVEWGVGTDVPVPADYDEDGKADPAVYRPSTGQWFILQSSVSYATSILVSWGASTDVPVQGDYDGDGKADLAVYRPSTGQWFILQSSTSYTTSIVVVWGVSTDVPVPGDYDGDGRTDPAVYRPSTGQWYFLSSSSNYMSSGLESWGVSTDIPVPGDYDGDGRTDPAVFRPSTGTWYILKSSTDYTTSIGVSWGVSSDTPINERSTIVPH